MHGFCLDMGTFHFQRRAWPTVASTGWSSTTSPATAGPGRLETGEYDARRCRRAALRAVLDATVPKGRVVLVGHSMGGMAIMAFADRWPELFEPRGASPRWR